MKDTQFTLANRKQISDLLDDTYSGLRARAKQKFRTKREEVRKKLVNEYAEKKAAPAVVKQIDVSRKKLNELEAELNTLGFDLDGSDLVLYSQHSNPLHKIISERLVQEVGTESDIDARFESAQVALMTVSTLEDAQKLLKSVTEVQ